MKKFGVLIVCLILMFSISFVSAGWFGDAWGKITGNALRSWGSNSDSSKNSCQNNVCTLYEEGKVTIGEYTFVFSEFNSYGTKDYGEVILSIENKNIKDKNIKDKNLVFKKTKTGLSGTQSYSETNKKLVMITPTDISLKRFFGRVNNPYIKFKYEIVGETVVDDNTNNNNNLNCLKDGEHVFKDKSYTVVGKCCDGLEAYNSLFPEDEKWDFTFCRMKKTEAFKIASDKTSGCSKEGTVLNNDKAYYNKITLTWWFDTNIVKTGCSPKCVVDTKTKTPEINWMCTGAIVEDNPPAPIQKSSCSDNKCKLYKGETLMINDKKISATSFSGSIFTGKKVKINYGDEKSTLLKAKGVYTFKDNMKITIAKIGYTVKESYVEFSYEMSTVVPPAPVIPPTPATGCVDSDGGNAPFKTGSVVYNGKQYADACEIQIYKSLSKTNPISIDYPMLKEYYCDENGELKQTYIYCNTESTSYTFPVSYGCENGACIYNPFNIENYNCYDEDGINYYKKVLTMSIKDGKKNQKEEFCMGVDNMLKEFLCDVTGLYYNSDTYCPPGYACYDGACVNSK